MKLTVENRTFDISRITKTIASDNRKCVVIEYKTADPEVIDRTQIVNDRKLAEKVAIYIITAIENAKGCNLLRRLDVRFSLN